MIRCPRRHCSGRPARRSMPVPAAASWSASASARSAGRGCSGNRRTRWPTRSSHCRRCGLPTTPTRSAGCCRGTSRSARRAAARRLPAPAADDPAPRRGPDRDARAADRRRGHRTCPRHRRGDDGRREPAPPPRLSLFRLFAADAAAPDAVPALDHSRSAATPPLPPRMPSPKIISTSRTSSAKPGAFSA